MKNGIINLRKEAGMTSHDAVFKLRRILSEKKIGHGGTLDPDVVGVLPIAMGKATRVLEFMTDSGKVYEGTVTLGFATTTEDSSGEVVARTPVTADLSEEDVDQAMASFIGDIRQVPPLYSAVKVKGKRLYEYAREGLSVERPERQVHITSFERTSPLRFEGELVSFDFRVACGKGTYVRTLAVDLGQVLGYASHMSFLRRTQAGGLDLADSLSLEEVAECVAVDDWSFIQPIEKGLSNLPGLDVTDSQAQDLSHGRFIQLAREEDLLVAYHGGLALAILQKRDETYKPKKVLRHVGD